jgi:hypothetical protein
LAWEEHILGQPISSDPFDLSPNAAGGCTPLAALAGLPRQSVRVIGVRLPGWTGGKGFFLSDRAHFVIAIPR